MELLEFARGPVLLFAITMFLRRYRVPHFFPAS